jgi:hypothetical protein
MVAPRARGNTSSRDISLFSTGSITTGLKPPNITLSNLSIMDAIFAMDQYYSSSSSTSTVDDNDSKFELESYDAVMTSPEVDVCSTKTASPDPKSSPSERASSDRSASPRDAQSWNSSNRRRKRAEEIHRPYVCGWDGCNKAYGRLNHLNTHIAIHRHGQRKTGMGNSSLS